MKYRLPHQVDFSLNIRKAIHVGSRPFGNQSGAVFDKMVYDFMQSEREVLEFLLDKYRVNETKQ